MEFTYVTKDSIASKRIEKALAEELPSGIYPENPIKIYSDVDPEIIIYHNYELGQWAIRTRESNKFYSDIEADVWAREQINPQIVTAPKSPNCRSMNFVRDMNSDPRKIPKDIMKILQTDPKKRANLANAMQQKIWTSLDETLAKGEDALMDRIYEIEAAYICMQQWVVNNRIKVLDAEREKNNKEYSESRIRKANKELRKAHKSRKANSNNSSNSSEYVIENDPLYVKYKNNTKRIQFFKSFKYHLDNAEAHAICDKMGL